MVTRAVLFDFYGTLARAVTWGATLEDVLGARGLALSPDARAGWAAEVADGVEHVAHSVDRDHYIAWERARLGRLAAACGARGADLEATVEALYAAVKDFRLEAYPEVAEVLSTLRSRGTTVAVCSNWDWDLERAMQRAGLAGLADIVVTSAQAGARKPHPRIYADTLARCGPCLPADAVFVGDTWGADVVGPAALGMRPVHLWRDEPDRDEPPPPGDVPRVADLAGVLGYL